MLGMCKLLLLLLLLLLLRRRRLLPLLLVLLLLLMLHTQTNRHTDRQRIRMSPRDKRPPRIMINKSPAALENIFLGMCKLLLLLLLLLRLLLRLRLPPLLLLLLLLLMLHTQTNRHTDRQRIRMSPRDKRPPRIIINKSPAALENIFLGMCKLLLLLRRRLLLPLLLLLVLLLLFMLHTQTNRHTDRQTKDKNVS